MKYSKIMDNFQKMEFKKNFKNKGTSPYCFIISIKTFVV